MRSNYCPKCGTKLILKKIGDEGDVPFCTECCDPVFDSFSACTINVAVNEIGEFALIRQSYGDTEKYVLVAGFIKPGETAEQSSEREIREELGINTVSVKYIKSYAHADKDQLMLGFVCKVKKSGFKISDEVYSAGWFKKDEALEKLKNSRIAKQLLLDYLEAKQSE